MQGQDGCYRSLQYILIWKRYPTNVTFNWKTFPPLSLFLIAMVVSQEYFSLSQAKQFLIETFHY